MCGLTGFFDPSGETPGDWAAIARAMADTVRHRGPDDEGVWVNREQGIALGHRRLSIIDLSPEGHQPMVSASGRYVIVFNGEIYNFADLRRQLDQAGPIHWRGHSDTEVLLAAIEAWGVEATLKRCAGMFAFALWDRTERALQLARDRLGEKPLYYGWMGRTLLFGSELKSLRAHPRFRGEIDRGALALFMRHNYVPGPYSIFRNVAKLPPGTFLTVRAADTPGTPVPTPYWPVREVVETCASQPLRWSEDEVVEELDTLLKRAVRLQMVADVPLGAFLSGGIDSSTVVALMQASSPRPVKTFTIGFHEDEYNEAHHAQAVASHLGTEHTELYVTPEQALDVVPQLPHLYDEPFADASQIPTFLVSHLARQHVTVSLSGDAGDELFCGYSRYFWATGLWRRIGMLPGPMRTAAAGLLRRLHVDAWNAVLAPFGPMLPERLRGGNPGDRLHKLAELLAAREPEAIYLHLVSHWKDPAQLVRGATEPSTPLTDPERAADLPDFASRMMYLDLVTYLPDDILVKVDRAAMAVSLESRVPLLDHHVVEFAWRVPHAMKVRDGQGKWILRRVLDKYVPRELIERPKMGFGVPIDHWLRGPLRDWAEDLLAHERLAREGYLDPEPVREKWREHLSGKRNWQYPLWNVLMFQSWLQAQQGVTP